MDELWKYFKCTRCGKCCKEIGLPYDPESIFEIAAHFEVDARQIIKKHYGAFTEDGQGWESDDSKRTPCPFLNFVEQDAACEIYNVRPDGCKLYPMETDFGDEGIGCPARKVAIDKLIEEQSKIEI